MIDTSKPESLASDRAVTDTWRDLANHGLMEKADHLWFDNESTVIIQFDR